MFLGLKLILGKKEDVGADIFQLEKQKGHPRVIIFKEKKFQMSRSAQLLKPIYLWKDFPRVLFLNR